MEHAKRVLGVDLAGQWRIGSLCGNFTYPHQYMWTVTFCTREKQKKNFRTMVKFELIGQFAPVRLGNRTYRGTKVSNYFQISP